MGVMIQNDRRARAMLALRQVCGESRARKHLFLEAFDLIYDYAGIQLDDPAARVALILNFDDEIRSIQSEKELKVWCRLSDISNETHFEVLQCSKSPLL